MRIEEEAEKWAVNEGYYGEYIANAENKVICANMYQEDADFILRACRCHRRLLRIAKLYVKMREENDKYIGPQTKLRKLIAEAEGKE